MINIFEPITAGIVVALFNKFVLNGSSETTTAVNTDTQITHHIAAHVF